MRNLLKVFIKEEQSAVNVRIVKVSDLSIDRFEAIFRVIAMISVSIFFKLHKGEIKIKFLFFRKSSHRDYCYLSRGSWCRGDNCYFHCKGTYICKRLFFDHIQNFQTDCTFWIPDKGFHHKLSFQNGKDWFNIQEVSIILLNLFFIHYHPCGRRSRGSKFLAEFF